MRQAFRLFLLTFFLKISVAADVSWITLAPMPDPQQEVATAELNGKVYVIGGFPGSDRVQEYDLASNTWRIVAPLPIQVDHAAAASVGGKLYVIGGRISSGNSSALYEYDPAANRWTRKTSMPTPRNALAAAVIDGKIYAVGGASATGRELEVYDPATDIWIQRAMMPTGRNHMAAGAIRGKLYVAGGRPNDGSVLEVYDPASNTWGTKARMPTARSGHAGAVVDDKFYTFGGEGNPNSPIGIFREVEVYDPEKDSWTSLEPMPTPRHGIGAAGIGRRIYLPGGATRAGGGSQTGLNEAFVVQPETLWFAHFAAGPGFDGELVLGNPGASAVVAVVEIRDQQGKPLELILGNTLRSRATVSIPPLGSATLRTSDTGNTVRAGSIMVSSEGPVSGVLFFADGISGLDSSSPLSRFFFAVQRDSVTSAGVAIANTTDSSVSVELILRREGGQELARRQITLSPRGQFAELLEKAFPAAGIESENFRGTVTGAASGSVVILALLFRGKNFTTLPVTTF
jgi:N-acetylneuraminic acid mutarotase